MTFGDLCRSNGGSYYFGAIETFDQHAKIYRYTDFHPNRTGGVNRTGSDFPIAPCYVLSPGEKPPDPLSGVCASRTHASPATLRIVKEYKKFLGPLPNENPGYATE